MEQLQLSLRTAQGSSDSLFVCADAGEHEECPGSREYSSGDGSFPLSEVSEHAFLDMQGKSGSGFGLGRSMASGASSRGFEAEDTSTLSGSTRGSHSMNQPSKHGDGYKQDWHSLSFVCEPKPAHPHGVAPMQLDYILNRNEGSGSPVSSLSALSSIQETPSSFTSPTISARREQEVQKQAHSPIPSQLDGMESGNGGITHPKTPSHEANTTTPADAAVAAAIIEQAQPSLTHTQFEEVTAHTAKCDLCNARNDSGMSRCLSCGWQSCHACTINNGCARTHNAGSRVHTCPIDRTQLVSSSSPKGRKKKNSQNRSKAQPKRDGESRNGPARRSQHKRGRGQSQPSRTRGGARKARTPSLSPDATVTPPPSFADDQSAFPVVDEPSSPGVDIEMMETEKYLEGARDLYAFSLEAYLAWVHEQRKRNPAQEWAYHASGGDNLHGYAQENATRAFEEYRYERARKVEVEVPRRKTGLL